MTEMPAPGAPDDDELDGQEPDEDTAGPDEGPPDEREVAADGDADRTPPEVAALRREAAGYRRRLREAEAERDGLVERVGVVHRGEAERVAADVLSDPADLWRGDGVDLAGLLDERGDVDAAAVARAARVVAAAHPHWSRLRVQDGGARAGQTPERRGDPLGDAVRQAAGGG